MSVDENSTLADWQRPAASLLLPPLAWLIQGAANVDENVGAFEVSGNIRGR